MKDKENDQTIATALSILADGFKKLADGLEEISTPAPQPVATLCDAAEALMLFVDQHCNYHDLDPLLADVRHALAAERKRAVLVKNALNAASKYVEQYRDTSFAKYVIEAVDALDAFDKGAV